jgi:CheY-like chemotaxis protein
VLASPDGLRASGTLAPAWSLVILDIGLPGATGLDVLKEIRTGHPRLPVLVLSALQRITAGERFDIIVCDLMMPQMTGMDLHAALTRAAPDQAARMVFLTGGAFTERARRFLEVRAGRRPRTARRLRCRIAATDLVISMVTRLENRRRADELQ